LFSENRIPTYYTPERAVRAFIDMVNYRRNQEALIQTPPSISEDFEPDAVAARRIIARALKNQDDWLTEADSKGVLSAYGIPITPVRAARDAEAATAEAEALGGPVALKILSPDIRHKSDVGGVVLDLRDPDEVRQAADRMLMRVREKRPDARIEGFTIQPMIDKPEAHELIVGVDVDPQFGPVILFGHGGLGVEILEDTAVALPPLNMNLARDLMARTRVYGLLQGIRGQPPAALDDIALTLIKVSQLIIDFAEVVELTINPLLADSAGVIALDAKIRVRPADGPPAHRLAIRPYPRELEEIIAVPDGRKFLLRPVRPEDEPALRAMFDRMSPDALRLRFFIPKTSLSPKMAARLSQTDYDREMALGLVQPEPAGTAEIYGGVRISADPDGEKAEFAISLRSDMAGQGLGPVLMQKIIDYSRQRGIRQIFGTVLRENRPMLKVCERLGFSQHTDFSDPGVVEVQLDL
jgi:acetyltransferase